MSTKKTGDRARKDCDAPRPGESALHSLLLLEAARVASMSKADKIEDLLFVKDHA